MLVALWVSVCARHPIISLSHPVTQLSATNVNVALVTEFHSSHRYNKRLSGLSEYLANFFWNEVPYMRVEQGTYSTESETLYHYHGQHYVTIASRSPLRCRYAWVALCCSFLRCSYA